MSQSINHIHTFDQYALQRTIPIDTVLHNNKIDLHHTKQHIVLTESQPTITLQQHHTILQHHIDTFTRQYIQQYSTQLQHHVHHTITQNQLQQLKQRLNLQSTIAMYKSEMLSVLNNKHKHIELDALISQQHSDNIQQRKQNDALRHNNTASSTQVAVKRYEQKIIDTEYTPLEQYIWYTQQLHDNTVLLQQGEIQVRNTYKSNIQLEQELITVLAEYKNKNLTLQRQLHTFDLSAQQQLQYLDTQLSEYSTMIKSTMNTNNVLKHELQQLQDTIDTLQSTLQNKKHELITTEQQYTDTLTHCTQQCKSVQNELMETSAHIIKTLNQDIKYNVSECHTSLTDTLRLDLTCKQCYELLIQPVLLQPCCHTLCKKCIQPYRIDLNSNTCICNECKTQYQHTLNTHTPEHELLHNHVILENDTNTLYRNPYYTATIDTPYTDSFTYSDNHGAVQLLHAYHTCMDTIECHQPLIHTLIQQATENIQIHEILKQLDKQSATT